MKSLNFAYNPGIDQLRWLAATLVFLFHFHLDYKGLGGAGLSTPWAALVTEGHTGVGLFFTLSGFLFMLIALEQKQIVYREFVRNRVLRIFPLFLTIFLVATSIGRDKFQPQDILYLLATNLGMAPTSGTVITGAAWTISLEFLFYLVFPLLARFAMERGLRYLAGLLGLMLFFKLAAYTVNDNSTHMYFSTFVGRFDQFLIGMAAAMLYRARGALLHRHAGLVLACSAVLVVCDTALLHRVAGPGSPPHAPFWIFWPTIESAGWALFIVAWVSFGARLPAPVARALAHGGKISFSFYLLHMGLLHLLARQVGIVRPSGVPWLDVLLMLVTAYAATWALATLSYNTIEAPFLRLRRRYGSAPQLKRVPAPEQPPSLTR
jgi:peptidoglycan/LPS O-acetylase OafA/YrhL